MLRFDLHVPVPEAATGGKNSVVRVYLDDEELQSSAFQGLVKGNRDTTGKEYPAADLRKVDDNQPGEKRQTQSNRIDFAKDGFQTFQVDIPNKFRGKVKTLRFEVSGGKT